MLLPRVFMDDLFENPFEEFTKERRPMLPRHQNELMKTDIKENEGNYELAMNLPGFKKEDVKIALNEGYLTISASTSNESKENDKDGHLIRQERYSGSCQRSFYVGEGINNENVKAKFEDGVLHLVVPKVDQKEIDNTRYIEIE